MMTYKKIFHGSICLLQAAFILPCLWVPSAAALTSKAETTARETTSPLSSPSVQDWPVKEEATLYLEASLTEGGATITNGLFWRIFKPKTEGEDKLPLVVSSQGGNAEFKLPPGNYILHVAYGRAGIAKQITLKADENTSEHIVLNAGGLKLNASLPNGTLNNSQLKFSIYSDGGENNEHALIVRNVAAGSVVRLNAGTYHVVCEYGTANAVVRSDLKVDPGKLTEATMQQRAAQITLKLVRQEGGEALADTSWAIMNDSGDIVREIANANAYVILTEGNYIAVARNRDQIYQKGFSVSSGKDQEIKIPATAQNRADEDMID